MACMCGDICCPSCGPAQGNSRCPICQAWLTDGCEHFEAWCATCNRIMNIDTEDVCDHVIEMRLKAEFTAEAERLARLENEAYEQLANELEVWPFFQGES